MFRQLLEAPDMAKFIADGGFDKAVLVGSDYSRWLEQKGAQVKELMMKAGWVK
jgi:tripartite-type tricarboxylate transporter receptor subunit TctC